MQGSFYKMNLFKYLFWCYYELERYYFIFAVALINKIKAVAPPPREATPPQLEPEVISISYLLSISVAVYYEIIVGNRHSYFDLLCFSKIYFIHQLMKTININLLYKDNMTNI